MEHFQYIKAISGIPVPTRDQTRKFAEYVSGAHSWYKHLPLYPARTITFFLDPNAGRQMVRKALGSVTFIDVDKGSNPFHYSTIPTAEYRERFGFWNYHAPYGSLFLIGSNEGLLDTRSSPGPVVLDSNNDVQKIPDALQRAGNAQFTSLVHPLRNFQVYWGIDPAKPDARLKYPEVFHRESLSIPEEVRNSILTYMAIIEEQASMPSKEWPELEPLIKQAEEILNQKINPGLDEIRESQLQGLEHAMNEFVRLARGRSLSQGQP